MRTKLPTIQVQQINHTEAGKTVRNLRKRSGMSLRKLAKEMGFTAPFISDLERGRRNWTAENFARAICIVTGGAK